MPKVELPFEALLEATEQLDPAQLAVLSQRLTEVQRFQKKRGFTSEAEQIKEQYEKLSLSSAEWQRYEELVGIRRAGNLNATQEQDWHALTTHNEELSVARVALLAEFADRHHLSLTEVMRRLKIKAREALVI